MKKVQVEIRPEDGAYMLPIDIAAQLCGVSGTTLRNFATGPDPAPSVGFSKFPAGELGNWMRQKQIVRETAHGKYPYLPDTVVIKSLRMPSAATEQIETTLHDEKLRHEKAKADKVELEVQVRRGDLIEATTVADAWGDILSRVKTRLLQVPYTAATMIVGMEELPQIQQVLNEVVRDALREMSEDWRETESEDAV